MTFSKQVGLEPATDLKKRIRSLCKEAGFVVAASRMLLHCGENLENSFRSILVYVGEPGWRPTVAEGRAASEREKITNHHLEVRAFIGCDGSFRGTVQVLASATDREDELLAPALCDARFPLEDLPRQLPVIVQQRREVIAGRLRGEQGPWQFGDGPMRWEEVSLDI